MQIMRPDMAVRTIVVRVPQHVNNWSSIMQKFKSPLLSSPNQIHSANAKLWSFFTTKVESAMRSSDSLSVRYPCEFKNSLTSLGVVGDMPFSPIRH